MEVAQEVIGVVLSGLNNLFNSFRYGGFGFGYSWITSFVTILTIIIIAYIIIDLIRNRRD